MIAGMSAAFILGATDFMGGAIGGRLVMMAPRVELVARRLQFTVTRLQSMVARMEIIAPKVEDGGHDSCRNLDAAPE